MHYSQYGNRQRVVENLERGRDGIPFGIRGKFETLDPVSQRLRLRQLFIGATVLSTAAALELRAATTGKLPPAIVKISRRFARHSVGALDTAFLSACEAIQ